MKNKIHSLAFLLIFVSAVSCKKDITQASTKSSIANQSLEQQRAYVQENLKIIIGELWPVIKDAGFKSLIHSEVAKKFDGSYNVLIKNLLADPVYGIRLNTAKMKKALDAFRNINGENLYPQIYIPNFSKHQQQLRTTSANRIANTDITAEFVIYDGNETVSEVPSYTYNEEGEVIPTGSIVNEQYAMNNEIYVLSINESVDNDGILPPQIATSHPPAINTVNFRIEKIYVKESKESWLAGDSEVNIKSIAATWNHRRDGNPLDAVVEYPTLRYVDNSNNYKGYEIKKVPRSDINSGVGSQYTINYPLNENWKVDNFFTDPIAYTYVIFEYDKWPAGQKTAASLIPSSPDPTIIGDYLNFRSSNSPYGGEVSGYDSYTNYAIYGNTSGLPANLQYLFYDGYQLTSSSLEFNTKKY